jgi:glycosyltransferase involved in cell wall biosynthesis
MRKLRVGVWLYEDIKPEEGGWYSYYSQLINKIGEYTFKDAEIVFLSDSAAAYRGKVINVHVIERDLKKKFRIYRMLLKCCNFFDFGHVRFKNLLKKKIRDDERRLHRELYAVADVIYYPVQRCNFPFFPYIYTQWDWGHISMFAFPEVSMNNRFESRKKWHDNIVQKALFVFTESNTGKQEAIRYLNLNADRIKVVPLFPSSIVDKKITPVKPESIGENLFFIHYPAQYWAHKNHYNLIIAFKEIVKEFPHLKLILTGSDKGNKSYILSLIKELLLTSNVLDLGFVKLEELKWIYLNSQGLVMPTFLGPTNMPLLEAAELQCPVACSHLKGHVEQLAEYGYYFNPLKPEEIAAAVRLMISDKQKGIMKKYTSIFNIDNTMKAIDEAFSEIRDIRFCWGGSDDRR